MTFDLALAIFMWVCIVVLVLRIAFGIEGAVMREDIYYESSRHACGEEYPTLEGTEYAQHKKWGHILEYHYDSQGGCWTGVDKDKQEIIKKYLTRNSDGKLICTKRV